MRKPPESAPTPPTGLTFASVLDKLGEYGLELDTVAEIIFSPTELTGADLIDWMTNESPDTAGDSMTEHTLEKLLLMVQLCSALKTHSFYGKRIKSVLLYFINPVSGHTFVDDFRQNRFAELDSLIGQLKADPRSVHLPVEAK